MSYLSFLPYSLIFLHFQSRADNHTEQQPEQAEHIHAYAVIADMYNNSKVNVKKTSSDQYELVAANNPQYAEISEYVHLEKVCCVCV